MSTAEDRVKVGFSEMRVLVLGTQVLLGFGFQAVFAPGFARLPEELQYLKLGAIILMLTAVGLLMYPTARHWMVDVGESSPEVPRTINRLTAAALLPFALASGDRPVHPRA